MNKPTEITLPEDQYMNYNGVRVHWFIGDYNDGSKAWEAWGSCFDNAGIKHIYQMFGLFDQGFGRTGMIQQKNQRRLFNIQVLNDPTNIYHCEETYKMLTR